MYPLRFYSELVCVRRDRDRVTVTLSLHTSLGRSLFLEKKHYQVLLVQLALNTPLHTVPYDASYAKMNLA